MEWVKKLKAREYSDLLNPVFVKEMRQYFNNRILLTIMGLMLTAQLVLLFSVRGIFDSSEAGAGFFYVIGIATVIGVFIVSGIGAMMRFSDERADKELDYSCLSNMTPARIVFGKFVAAGMMMVFLTSLSLPFMAIAYFLRGIPLTIMFYFTCLWFLQMCLVVLFGLLIGSFGKRAMQFLFYGGMWFLCWAFAGLSVLVGESAMGSRGFPSGTDTIGIFAIALVAMLCAGGLLFLLSVAVLGSAHSNRMFPVRVYLAGLFFCVPLLGYAGYLILQSLSGSTGTIERLFFHLVAILTMGASVSILAILASFERDSAGRRVLLSCPKGYFGRRFHFLLSSGNTAGILLSVLLLSIFFLYTLLLITGAGSGSGGYSREIAIFALLFLNVTGYLVFYAIAALLLRKYLLSSLPGWVCFLSASLTLTLVPLILSIPDLSNSFPSIPYTLIPSVAFPFALIDRFVRNYDVLPFVISFSGVILVLGAFACYFPTLMRQMILHRRPDAGVSASPVEKNETPSRNDEGPAGK